jgi:hypothetical protein
VISARFHPQARVNKKRRAAHLACLALGLVLAGGLDGTAAHADVEVWSPNEQTRLSVFGSLLSRLEAWSWFEGGADADNDYVDAFETVRLGVKLQHSRVNVLCEGQHTQFQNLPGDAAAPAPRGALGTGATYFQHTGDRSATAFFIKHLYLSFKDLLVPWFGGVDLRLGRFAYLDGLEAATGEAKIDWLKRVRGSEKLIGPFGWSAFQRSFDGIQVGLDQPLFNWTTMVSRPTQGGFEEKAGETIDTIGLLATSLTLKPSAGLPHTAPRFFYLRYDDERNVSQRVDNVTATAPKVDIAINTYGAELAGGYPLGDGELHWLAWVAGQEGDWYELDHRAAAMALESGYQWTGAPWAPHLRAGWLYGSGDSESGDGRHGTFFQMLPTARKYAQLPFYNFMNSSDLFVQGFVKPHKAVTVRSDWHWISLAERNDRWYSGTGATQERGQLFGFAGRASQGKRGLGQLVDLSVTYAPTSSFTLYGYYGHVFGSSVIEAIYAGASANFVYLESEIQF